MTTTTRDPRLRVGWQIDRLDLVGPTLPPGTVLSHYGTDLVFTVEDGNVLHRDDEDDTRHLMDGTYWVRDRWTIESLPDSVPDRIVIDSVEEPPDRVAYARHVMTDEAAYVAEDDGTWEERIRTIALGRVRAHASGSTDVVSVTLDRELTRFPFHTGMIVHPFDLDLLSDLPDGTTLTRYGLRPDCPEFSVHVVDGIHLVNTGVTDKQPGAGLLYVSWIEEDYGPPEDHEHDRDAISDRIVELCGQLKSSQQWCSIAEATLREMGLMADTLLYPYTPEGVREMPEGSVVRYSANGYSRLFVRDDSMTNPARTRGIGHTFGDWSSAPVTLVKAAEGDMRIATGSVTELESMPLGTVVETGGSYRYQQTERGWVHSDRGFVNPASDFLIRDDGDEAQWHYTHIPNL